MRDVKSRRQGWFFADLIGAEDLGDFNDLVSAAAEILECNRTVAGAKINSEAKTCAHLMGCEDVVGISKYHYGTSPQEYFIPVIRDSV